jgi:hypothetical protein
MSTDKSTGRKSPLALSLALLLGAVIYGCSGSAGRPASTSGTGGEGDTGGSSGGDTGGKTGTTGNTGGATGSTGGATGGSGDTGGSGGATGGSGDTGGSGGANTGGSGDTGGSGGSTEADAGAKDASPASGDGGHKIDPKSPILACNGGYNLQGVTADDFCSFYEMYCMYDPTGMAKNPSGTALPPGTGSWFYKDRADCIMRYNMASMPAKGCRAGQLCRNKMGGCTHATGHFSNCP